jgi:hypothetical protein
MKKHPEQSQPISAEVKKAYTAWLNGEAFRTVKKRVGKPPMKAFARLSGATTWKATRAARDKAVKATRKAKP